MIQSVSLLVVRYAMHRMYKFQRVPLQPPIVFGRTHSYRTRATLHFDQPVPATNFPLLKNIFNLKQHYGGMVFKF